MYIEHPYFYEGKYYANIDGEMIEITKEVAYAMEMNVFVIALALIAAKNGIQHFIVADICGSS